MRLVSALLFVALTGSTVVADEAKPADPKPEVAKTRVPLRVVRMLTETRQVLLLDKNRGTHVVADVGQEIDGFIVDEIADDEVTLIAPNGAEVILTAPDMTWRRRAAERKAAAAKKAAGEMGTVPISSATGATTGGEMGTVPISSATGAPATGNSTTGGEMGTVPISSAPATGNSGAPGETGTVPISSSTPEAGPVDPYADSTEPAPPDRSASAGTSATRAPIRSASAGMSAVADAPAPTGAPTSASGAAPSDPYAELDPGIAAFVQAVGATPAPAPQAPVANQPQPPAVTTPAPPPPVPAAPANSFTLARADVDAALSDFGATAVTFDAKFVADGLRIDSVAEGTILAKAGLRKGDTITTIDGKPLRSFDDAADLYARMGTARAATIAIVRAGKPLTLRVTIR